jgi:hypothetical protein
MAPGVRFLPLGARRAELRNGGRDAPCHRTRAHGCLPAPSRKRARSSLREVRPSPSLEQLDTEENP